MNIEHSSSTNEITYCTPISTDRRLRPLAEREKDPLSTMAGLKEVL